jgi:hypothetical protein
VDNSDDGSASFLILSVSEVVCTGSRGITRLVQATPDADALEVVCTNRRFCSKSRALTVILYEVACMNRHQRRGWSG